MTGILEEVKLKGFGNIHLSLPILLANMLANNYINILRLIHLKDINIAHVVILILPLVYQVWQRALPLPW